MANDTNKTIDATVNEETGKVEEVKDQQETAKEQKEPAVKRGWKKMPKWAKILLAVTGGGALAFLGYAVGKTSGGVPEALAALPDLTPDNETESDDIEKAIEQEVEVEEF